MYTRTKIRVWAVHNWLKFQPFSWLVEIIELRKGEINWLRRKGGGFESTQHNTLNTALTVDLFKIPFGWIFNWSLYQYKFFYEGDHVHCTYKPIRLNNFILQIDLCIVPLIAHSLVYIIQSTKCACFVPRHFPFSIKHETISLGNFLCKYLSCIRHQWLYGIFV